MAEIKVGGTWLASIGDYGSWGDLQWITRWGDGACGMYEAQWTMPLPADFEHPLLRRGQLVEIGDGPIRFGSPLVLSEPSRGSGYHDPWRFVATGVGREVEGENSWYCDDGAGNTTSVASVAIDVAIADGLQWAGRHSSIPTAAFGPASTDGLNTIGSLLNSYGDSIGQRWGVGQDGLVRFMPDPATPEFHVVPDVAKLGTADDGYATVVKLRYKDSATGAYATAISPSSPSAVEQRFGRREYAADVTTSAGPIPAATAQAWADGILAKTKGRLGWTDRLNLTPNQILNSGGEPATDLSMVAEAVARGVMVQLHGISNDLLEFNGQTWLDIVIGEARLADGADTIDLAPMGLAPRDFAAIVEAVTGTAKAA